MWRRVWIEKRRSKRHNTYRLRWYDREGKLKSQYVGPGRSKAERLRLKKEYEING
jgi:hypothetical protein